MICTILYDNAGGKGLDSGWGFSCLVEAHGKRVLFDTSDNGRALMSNMEKLGIDIGNIDCVFISHGHWDHIGGIDRLIAKRGRLPVFAPSSAFNALERFLGQKAEIIKISKPKELFKGFYTTGEMARFEQSLVVETEKGNVVITGCGHPGLDNIIECAGQFGKVYGAIGGFHDFSDLGKLEGLGLIMPCHCTQVKRQVPERFPQSAKECRSGAVIEVK